MKHYYRSLVFALGLMGLGVWLALVFPQTLSNAAVTATPVFPQTPGLGLQNFIQGTDTAGTFKAVYTGGTNGSKCMGLIASSTDGSASHLITIQLKRTATSYTVMAATVAASAGSANGIPPQPLMGPGLWTGLPTDSDGNPFIYLATNADSIQATYATALTAATQVNVIATCADF